MDLQSALLQLQANVRNQVEIILTNLAGVATREHFDEALYNQFIASRQAIPVIYGQMLGWSSQLNNMSFAQALQSLAEAINVITLDVDASLQQGIDDARKQSLINGVTNADTVMASFLQQVRVSCKLFFSSVFLPSVPLPCRFLSTIKSNSSNVCKYLTARWNSTTERSYSTTTLSRPKISKPRS